jgi:hypothetical protein
LHRKLLSGFVCVASSKLPAEKAKNVRGMGKVFRVCAPCRLSAANEENQNKSGKGEFIDPVYTQLEHSETASKD